MNTIEQELEQAFLKLPTLKHVGMALLQFAYGIQNTTNLQKTAGGVFRLDFVAFSFPEGGEVIRMYVNLEIEKINAEDMRWLPIRPDQSVQGFPVCEIKRVNQLGQAVGYIRLAYDKYLTTGQTTEAARSRN